LLESLLGPVMLMKQATHWMIDDAAAAAGCCPSYGSLGAAADAVFVLLLLLWPRTCMELVKLIMTLWGGTMTMTRTQRRSGSSCGGR
jgi:hypothetical protein